MTLPNARTVRRLVVVAVALALPLTSVAPAAAEWFADVYIGASSTKDSDVKVREAGITQRLQDVEFDRSWTFGGRFGHYLTNVPWLGFALDGMSYDANVDKQQVSVKGTGVRAQLAPIDISVAAISFDVMLRLPLLTTSEIPAGRLQPYLLAGPTLFWSSAEDSGNFIRRHQDDSDVSFGWNAGGGVGWRFTKDLGVFGEYRYTQAKPEFEFRNFDNRVTVKPDLNTHHFLVGISLRF